MFRRSAAKAMTEIGVEVSATGIANQRSDRFDVSSVSEEFSGTLQSHLPEILAKGAARAFSEEAPQMARREIESLRQEEQ